MKSASVELGILSTKHRKPRTLVRDSLACPAGGHRGFVPIPYIAECQWNPNSIFRAYLEGKQIEISVAEALWNRGGAVGSSDTH